jgi:hypothetical protein
LATCDLGESRRKHNAFLRDPGKAASVDIPETALIHISETAFIRISETAFLLISISETAFLDISEIGKPPLFRSRVARPKRNGRRHAAGGPDAVDSLPRGK